MRELRRVVALAALLMGALGVAYHWSPALAPGAAQDEERPASGRTAASNARTDSEGTGAIGTAPAGLALPLPGGLRVTSGYGRRRSPISGRPQFHPGVDLAAPSGTPVLAAAAGTVAAAGWYPREWSRSWWAHGNLVVLEHDGGAVSVYAHLARVDVLSGTFVTRGERLGVAGSTGAVTGPHLHFEVRLPSPDGTLWPVDPLLYVTALEVAAAPALGAPSGPQLPGGGVQSGRRGQSAPPGRVGAATGEAGRRSAAD